MKKSVSVGKVSGTVVTVIVVIALAVMCILLGDFSFSENQLKTFNILIIICAGSIIYCFAVGELSQNFSQMDKLWSVLPIVYLWVIAVSDGLKVRLVVYALIVTAWGIRLTVNFARKGAYSLKFWTGVEDYRWSIVRGMPLFKHKLAWAAFNLLFISTYQNLLVLAICLPALACMGSSAPLGGWDAAAAVLSILFLALETVSDEYQWKFHQTKKKLLAQSASLEDLPAPYDLGFNTTGPWGRMRHPNYLGEQGMWLSLYMFAIGAGAARYIVFNWSMIGPLLLILLFMGSSALGETISSNKYPAYRDYRYCVCKYIPVHGYRR